MSQLTVQPQQPKERIWHKDGEDIPIIGITALSEEHGTITCEAAGDRNKEILLELCQVGGTLTVGTMTYQEKARRWFMKGLESVPAGNGATPTVPRGNGPLSFDQWWNITQICFTKGKSITGDVESARALTAQFWIGYERKIVTLPTEQAAPALPGRSMTDSDIRQLNIFYIESIEQASDRAAAQTLLDQIKHNDQLEEHDRDLLSGLALEKIRKLSVKS